MSPRFVGIFDHFLYSSFPPPQVVPSRRSPLTPLLPHYFSCVLFLLSPCHLALFPRFFWCSAWFSSAASPLAFLPRVVLLAFALGMRLLFRLFFVASFYSLFCFATLSSFLGLLATVLLVLLVLGPLAFSFSSSCRVRLAGGTRVPWLWALVFVTRLLSDPFYFLWVSFLI